MGDRRGTLAQSTKPKGGTTGSKTSSSKGSEPPPSEAAGVPATSSSLPYLLGILLFGGGTVALLYTRCAEDEERTQPQASATATVEPSGEPINVDLPEFAPPPPPEEKDAGADAGAEKPADTGAVATPSGSSAPAPGPAGACANCGSGTASPALVTAVRGTAGTAQGCYNRALRQGGAQGKINVAVSVGSNGSVCGASVTSDTVGNPALTSCVLSKFRGRSYPQPESGCVVINVPLNFTAK